MVSKVRSIGFRKFYRMTPKIYHCAAFAPLFAAKKWNDLLFYFYTLLRPSATSPNLGEEFYYYLLCQSNHKRVAKPNFELQYTVSAERIRPLR